MGKYRITIDRLDNVADIPLVTVIECESEYTLREDMAEWVKVEIDPDATVEMVERPSDFSAWDAGIERAAEAAIARINCQECARGDHEDCPDNGLSSAPYWCECAANRHGGQS